MLQGSSNRTLTSKINRLCNFSYLSCEDIILSGGPSSEPVSFYLKFGKHRIFFVHHRVLFFSPIVGIPHFVLLKLFWFQILFCVTHRWSTGTKNVNSILKSDEFHDCNKSGKDLNLLDPDMKYAIQLSKAIEESRKSFLRYYATLVVKPKSSQ